MPACGRIGVPRPRHLRPEDVDCVGEGLRPQAPAVVHFDRPHRMGSDPEKVGRALVHHVRLGRGVERQARSVPNAALARLLARPVACQLEAHQVRHRAARHHVAARLRRQPEAAREPAHQMRLDRGRAGREPESAAVLVQRRRQQVGGRPRHCARARDVGKEARVARIHRVLEQERAQVAEQLPPLQRLLGNVDCERLVQLIGPELAANGQLG